MTRLKIVSILFFITVVAELGMTKEKTDAKFSMHLQCGYLFYSIENYNNFAKSAETYYTAAGLDNLYEIINGDFSFGFRTGYQLSKAFHITAGINWISTAKIMQVNFKYPTGEDNIFRGKTTFQLLPISMRSHYIVPTKWEKVKADVFAEISFNFARYKQQVILPTSGVSGSLPNSTNSKFGYAPGLNIIYQLHKQIGIVLETKYNILVIDGFEDENGKTIMFPSTNFSPDDDEKLTPVSLDFSGLFLNLGLRFNF
jgi:hypothetical protein